MRDLQIIYMPYDGALLAIDSLVYHTPVVRVDYESLLFETGQ